MHRKLRFESLESRRMLAVSFEFNYLPQSNSEPAVGFFHPTYAADFRNALQSAAKKLGDLFLHDVVIELDVVTKPSSNPSAFAGSEIIFNEPGFYAGVVSQKVLSNGTIDRNGSDSDGEITILFPVNQGDPESPENSTDETFKYTTVPLQPINESDYRVDFKSLVTHELVHTLGFTSATDASGKGYLGSAPNAPDAWSAFDQFIGDRAGNRIIDPTTFQLRSDVFNQHVRGGESLEPLEENDGTKDKGLFFHGPFAVKANEGKPVPLYSPTTYEIGSSTGHLDTTNLAFSNPDGDESQAAIMIHRAVAGPATDTLRVVETSMLIDLGFTLVPEAYPNSPPTISAIADQTIEQNTSTTPISFTISDAESPADQLTLRAVTSNTRLLPESSFVFGGSGRNRTLTITPTAGISGTASVTVGVTDEKQRFSSVRFTLTVSGTQGQVEIIVSSPNSTAQQDPPDLAIAPQPTSWVQQRSIVREILVRLPNPISRPPLNSISLTSDGPDNQIPRPLVNREEQISLSSDGKELRITFDPLNDGRYKLTLGPAITGEPQRFFGTNTDHRMFALKGDWNGSGSVNIQDFATFSYWFGQDTSVAPEYVDLNGSGGVNIQDFAIFAQNFGKSVLQADVNQDGRVTALDALLVINRLHINQLKQKNAQSELQSAFFDEREDTNRDGHISAIDALMVINNLSL